jgi:hypothetical protein
MYRGRGNTSGDHHPFDRTGAEPYSVGAQLGKRNRSTRWDEQLPLEQHSRSYDEYDTIHHDLSRELPRETAREAPRDSVKRTVWYEREDRAKADAYYHRENHARALDMGRRYPHEEIVRSREYRGPEIDRRFYSSVDSYHDYRNDGGLVPDERRYPRHDEQYHLDLNYRSRDAHWYDIIE